MFIRKHSLLNSAAEADGSPSGDSGTPSPGDAAAGSGLNGGDPPAAAAPAEPADWRTALPEDIRNRPSLKDVPDVATLAKMYDDTKAMVGSSVRIPTDDAGQEAIDAFNAKILDNPALGLMKRPDPDNPDSLAAAYDALGRPSEAGGYEMPEGVDAEVFGKLSEAAHKAGLTKAQYKAMAEAQRDLTAGVLQERETARLEGLKRLQGEWGPSYEQRLDRAASVVKALGGHPALEKAIADKALDENTARLLDTIAVQLGKGPTEVASQIGSVSAETIAELTQRRDELGNRLLNENLTPTQREDLIKRRVALSEKIIEYQQMG